MESSASSTSGSSRRRSSVVSQRVAAYEDIITRKRRVSDTLEGQRLDELSVITNSTKQSSSSLSNQTMVDNPTAEENFEVQINPSKAIEKKKKIINSINAISTNRWRATGDKKVDESLLGTHVSFTEGDACCEASCTTTSIADEGEEKLMAAIALATARKAGGTSTMPVNATECFDKMDQQNTQIAQGASRAFQEVERVLFFTDVIDRNPPKPKEETPAVSPLPRSEENALVTTGANAPSDLLSPLLEMSAVAMKGAYETMYNSSVEAYNELEKTVKEVERTLLFTDLSAGSTPKDEMASTIDPQAEVAKAIQKFQETLLFTDLPDDAIYHSKSLPGATMATNDDARVVNSSVSMCNDVHRTLCFTDLDEAREYMLQERKSSLMSQVLAEESLVTSADLERFQARIEEVRKFHLGETSIGGNRKETPEAKDITEVPATDAEEELCDPQEEEDSLAEILVEENIETTSEGEDSVVIVNASNSSSSSNDFRLLVEVTVGSSSKSVEEIDALAAAPKQFTEEQQDEEEITEELTESQTEESGPVDGESDAIENIAGKSCQVKLSDTEVTAIADYNSNGSVESYSAVEDEETPLTSTHQAKAGLQRAQATLEQ